MFLSMWFKPDRLWNPAVYTPFCYSVSFLHKIKKSFNFNSWSDSSSWNESLLNGLTVKCRHYMSGDEGSTETIHYSLDQLGTLGATTRRLSWISDSVNWRETADQDRTPPHLSGATGGGTYLKFSQLMDRLQSRAAEQTEGPLPTTAPAWPLLEAQRKHLGRQVDVPVGGVTLRQFTDHPVGGRAE